MRRPDGPATGIRSYRLSDNPLLRRQARIGEHGRKSEKRIAKKLGGRRTPASGAMAGAKGDTVLPDFLLESKATSGVSFSLRKEVLDKITREALEKNKVPAVSISFTPLSGEARQNGDWVAIPLWAFKSITGG